MPHLLVGQITERRHGRSRRTVFNDPKQLTAGKIIHRVDTGEVSRLGLDPVEQDAQSITADPMTRFTGAGFGIHLKQSLPGQNILRRGFQWVFPFQIFVRRLNRLARLRTDNAANTGITVSVSTNEPAIA